jgi:DNA-binding CsgD family transcriptional regulator
LLAEVARLRDHHDGWENHLAPELCRLFGGRECSIVRFADWGPVGEPRLLTASGGGWPDPKIAPLLLEFNKNHPPRTDPVLDEFSKITGDVQVVRISEFLGMERMFRSLVYEHVGRPAQVGDGLIGRFSMRNVGHDIGFLVHRASSDPLFCERQRALYQFLIEELHHLYTHGLLERIGSVPSIPPMPPREREIIELLLRGEGWKQIAYQLGLSRHTVSGYGKTLFKRLGVHSRAELAAMFSPPRSGNEGRNRGEAKKGRRKRDRHL